MRILELPERRGELTSAPGRRPRSGRRPSPPAAPAGPAGCRPSPAASASASGTEAAEVLAWRSMVTTTFSAARPSFFAHAVDDAAIGLMRHQPVDIARASRPLAASASSTTSARRCTAWRKTSRALHAQEARRCRWSTGRHRHRADRSRCRRSGDGSRGCRARAALPFDGAASQHHRAGAVAEQHAGAAVAPVEDAREGLGADHQRALAPGRARRNCRRPPARR